GVVSSTVTKGLDFLPEQVPLQLRRPVIRLPPSLLDRAAVPEVPEAEGHRLPGFGRRVHRDVLDGTEQRQWADGRLSIAHLLHQHEPIRSDILGTPTPSSGRCVLTAALPM